MIAHQPAEAAFHGFDFLNANVNDNIPPTSSAPQFLYQSGPLKISMAFNEDVSASLLGQACSA